MCLKSDIKWIQNELTKVEDPELIALFKRLLKYGRKHNPETIQKYNDDIARAEQDIDQGKTFSQNQIKDLREKWRKTI